MEIFYACIDETFKVVKATVTKFHVTALRSRMAKADEILDAVPDPEIDEKVFVDHLRSKDSTTKVLSEMKKAIDVAISEVTGTKDWGIEFDEDSGFQNYMSEVDNALAKGEALESVVFLNALVLLLRTAIIAMPQGKDIRANLLSVVGTFVQRQELLIPEALLERAKLLLLAYEDSKQACLALLEATNTKGETVVKKRAWAAGAIKEMRKKIRTDDEAIIPFDRDRLSASFTAQALPTPQPVSTVVKPKGKPTAKEAKEKPKAQPRAKAKGKPTAKEAKENMFKQTSKKITKPAGGGRGNGRGNGGGRGKGGRGNGRGRGRKDAGEDAVEEIEEEVAALDAE